MKLIKPIISVIFLLLLCSEGMAQVVSDTTAITRVAGACEMCRSRIEKAAMERKGVKQASWNSVTQLLTVSFNKEQVSLSQILCRVADRGHENDFETARDAVYKSFPSCCDYRSKIGILNHTGNPDAATLEENQNVKGRVI